MEKNKMYFRNPDRGGCEHQWDKFMPPRSASDAACRRTRRPGIADITYVLDLIRVLRAVLSASIRLPQKSHANKTLAEPPRVLSGD
jgi:hypothetical protein